MHMKNLQTRLHRENKLKLKYETVSNLSLHQTFGLAKNSGKRV